MKFGMFDVREKGASRMVAHGQDDVGVDQGIRTVRDVGRNLTCTGRMLAALTLAKQR